MELVIKGDTKEITALVVALQERQFQNMRVRFTDQKSELEVKLSNLIEPINETRKRYGLEPRSAQGFNEMSIKFDD